MQCILCALFVLRRAPSRFRLSIASNARIASAEVNARWLNTLLTTNRKRTWIQRTCVPTAAAKERNQKRLHTLLDANTQNLATKCVGCPSFFLPQELTFCASLLCASGRPRTSSLFETIPAAGKQCTGKLCDVMHSPKKRQARANTKMRAALRAQRRLQATAAL